MGRDSMISESIIKLSLFLTNSSKLKEVNSSDRFLKFHPFSRSINVHVFAVLLSYM